MLFDGIVDVVVDVGMCDGGYVGMGVRVLMVCALLLVICITNAQYRRWRWWCVVYRAVVSCDAGIAASDNVAAVDGCADEVSMYCVGYVYGAYGGVSMGSGNGSNGSNVVFGDVGVWCAWYAMLGG